MTAANSHAQTTRANAHAPGEVADFMDLDPIATPASPASGKGRLFLDTADGLLKWKYSDGTVRTIGAGIADQGIFTYFDGTVAAAPGTPAAGNLRIYAKTGKVLAVKDDAGLETVLGAAGSGAGVLGATTYSTGSDTPWASSSSTATADIDATNASLAIVVPASGKIVVSASLDWTNTVTNEGGYLVLRTGSTDLQSCALVPTSQVGGGVAAQAEASAHVNAMFSVSGLTPGALTVKLGFKRIGTMVLQVYANTGAGTAGHIAGPFVMVAWAA